MNLAGAPPALASTSNHSVANLGNAGGAYIGGFVITHMGLTSLPWAGAMLVGFGLILVLASYRLERKEETV